MCGTLGVGLSGLVANHIAAIVAVGWLLVIDQLLLGAHGGGPVDTPRPAPAPSAMGRVATTGGPCCPPGPPPRSSSATPPRSPSSAPGRHAARRHSRIDVTIPAAAVAQGSVKSSSRHCDRLVTTPDRARWPGTASPRTLGSRAARLSATRRSTTSCGQRAWCGKCSMCPKLIVPLQIDLAIGDRRYLFGRSANPALRSRRSRSPTRRGTGPHSSASSVPGG